MSNQKLHISDPDIIPSGKFVPMGFYACHGCAECIYIGDKGGKLPNCENYGKTYYMKI